MSSKKCPSCNFTANDSARFCPQCGAPLTQNKKGSPGRSTSRRDTLIIVGVIVIVSAGYLLLRKPQGPAPPATSEFSHPEVTGMEQPQVTSGLNFPTDYDALVQLGNQAMDQGNYPVAAESYRRALVINNHSPDVRTDYGACLHGMGLPDRALQEFRTVLADHPTHVIANFNMGIVYYNLNQSDSARAYWTKVLTLTPDSTLKSTVNQYLQQLGG
ncbi:MAG: tetratricopeptide repeat protein [Candidatus Zixiibacteriota bacterium]|nr:MAG: tetratricopeptide repeat protein [candidate division Zixibacteria bacterium]